MCKVLGSNMNTTEFPLEPNALLSTFPYWNLTSGSGDELCGRKCDGNSTTITSQPSVSGFFNLPWEKGCIVILCLLLIFITVIGNTLVILSVLTTRRLRTVTNCFVMNLAITDWLVGTFVMPPAVILYIVGSWQFGWILCDIWISLDVLLCTASILSLCAISLDRYLAVIQPLTYSKRRRSKRLALLMILVVWIVALAITCPPFLGWYEPGRRNGEFVDCRYNQNKGYVVFSAMGSFFIPLAVMLYVYLRIGCVLTSRRQRMTLTEVSEKSHDETFPTELENLHITPKHIPYKKYDKKGYDSSSLNHQTLYELVEISRSSSTIRCSTISCKIDSNHSGFKPIQAIHFCESQSSFSESCMSASKLKIQQPTKCQRIPMRISTLKRDTKTAKTLTMVMGGFIACWLPFFLYYLLIPFLPKEAISEPLMSFLTWLGWINCGINPFIYAFYSPDFRTAFWRLTFRKICKKTNQFTLFKT
ncbi:unnamed protein product [Hermetia illucens]|uniref:G-protein coupled receptors family 1 profile domain-containing protein n=1 Tax=Hermetia illucens TaxID=343691 RepID=A0A7R8Z1H0_HERIL|nr:unnamed protein product [Hermetia illucens]